MHRFSEKLVEFVGRKFGAFRGFSVLNVSLFSTCLFRSCVCGHGFAVLVVGTCQDRSFGAHGLLGLSGLPFVVRFMSHSCRSPFVKPFLQSFGRKPSLTVYRPHSSRPDELRNRSRHPRGVSECRG